MAERIAGRQIDGKSGIELLSNKAVEDGHYVDESQWVLSRAEIRDMLDSRKHQCQRVRHRQLREKLDRYAEEFRFGTMLPTA